MINSLINHIEALIFASEYGISLEEIKVTIKLAFDYETSDNEILTSLTEIGTKYDQMHSPLCLTLLNNSYQFLTKPDYYPVINQLQLQRAKKKLSQATLETLAIIAYRQPITKLEIEQIRGVTCDYTIQKLLDKELIVIGGKVDSVGKPLLYRTSALFMDYFGINNVTELPKLKDIIPENNIIGEEA